MHEVLANRLGGLSLSMKSVVRLTDRPDMTLDVYLGVDVKQQQLAVVFKNSMQNTLKVKIVRRDPSNYKWTHRFGWLVVLGLTAL